MIDNRRAPKMFCLPKQVQYKFVSLPRFLKRVKFMWQSTSVIDKMYKKLVIQVSLNGLSFATIDTITNKPAVLKKIVIEDFSKNSAVETLFGDAFKNHPELHASYDEVVIVHSNNLSTFVPTALFDEEYLGSYEQCVHSVCQHEQLFH
jgi:Protein of unknown function (DUF3822)